MASKDERRPGKIRRETQVAEVPRGTSGGTELTISWPRGCAPERGTLAYMVDVIADAGDARLFGKKNKMPRFAGKLSPEEIGDLARFVLSQSRK